MSKINKHIISNLTMQRANGIYHLVQESAGDGIGSGEHLDLT